MVESLVYFNVVYCLLDKRCFSLRWFTLPVPLKNYLYSSTFGLVKRLILAKIAPPPPCPQPPTPKTYPKINFKAHYSHFNTKNDKLYY